jgi:general secretion pathway protein H
VVTIGVMSIGDPLGDEVETEAKRLTALTQLAAEEAVLQSRELGIRFESDGYRFFALTATGWQPLEGDSILRHRRLPEQIEMELYLEGLPVDLDVEKDAPPQVFLHSSGERSPFELIVQPRSQPTPRFRLTAPLLGKLQLEPLEGIQ